MSKNSNSKSKYDNDIASELFSEINRSDSDFDSSSEDTFSDTQSYASSLSSVKITPQFRENVKNFVAYDDLIKKKTQEISEIKKKRKPCEEAILKYLDNVNQHVIDITDGKLKKNKSETKKPLNSEIIKNSIATKINDPEIVKQIMELMESQRATNTQYSLKRTGMRAKD
jgi:hypothetical protein